MKRIKTYFFIVFIVSLYSTIYILFFKKNENLDKVEIERIKSISTLSKLENSLDTNNKDKIISLNTDPFNSYNKYVREISKYIIENKHFIVPYIIDYKLRDKIYNFKIYETHFSNKKEKKSKGLKNLIIALYGKLNIYIEGKKINIQDFCIDSNINFEIKVERNSEFIFLQLYKDLGIFKDFNKIYLNQMKNKNENSISKIIY
jgi:hypothetical protein